MDSEVPQRDSTRKEKKCYPKLYAFAVCYTMLLYVTRRRRTKLHSVSLNQRNSKKQYNLFLPHADRDRYREASGSVRSARPRSRALAMRANRGRTSDYS